MSGPVGSGYSKVMLTNAVFLKIKVKYCFTKISILTLSTYKHFKGWLFAMGSHGQTFWSPSDKGSTLKVISTSESLF